MPIIMSAPLPNRDREMTIAANLRIDRIDHPEKNAEHFWLHRTNEYDGVLVYIKSRDTLGGLFGMMAEYKQVKSSEPESLFALVKVVIEKPNLLGIKVSAEIVSEMPELPKEEEPKKAPRRIIIRRKPRP